MSTYSVLATRLLTPRLHIMLEYDLINYFPSLTQSRKNDIHTAQETAICCNQHNSMSESCNYVEAIGCASHAKKTLFCLVTGGKLDHLAD